MPWVQFLDCSYWWININLQLPIGCAYHPGVYVSFRTLGIASRTILSAPAFRAVPSTDLGLKGRKLFFPVSVSKALVSGSIQRCFSLLE